MSGVYRNISRLALEIFCNFITTYWMWGDGGFDPIWLVHC